MEKRELKDPQVTQYHSKSGPQVSTEDHRDKKVENYMSATTQDMG